MVLRRVYAHCGGGAQLPWFCRPDQDVRARVNAQALNIAWLRRPHVEAGARYIGVRKNVCDLRRAGALRSAVEDVRSDDP